MSHDAYGGLLEFTADGATRPEPIRCAVSVFRSACELARPLATAAARKAILELEVTALIEHERSKGNRLALLTVAIDPVVSRALSQELIELTERVLPDGVGLWPR